MKDYYCCGSVYCYPFFSPESGRPHLPERKWPVENQKRNSIPANTKKTIRFLLLAVFSTLSFFTEAQTLYDWLNTAPDGNFRQGAAAARWNPGGLFDEPPSSSATRLRFNNTTFTTMTNNVGGTYTLGQIFFGSFATTGRTIGGNPVQFFEFGATWPRIENQSTALHTVNFPFSASTNNGFNMELVASAGPLAFGGTLNNNGRTVQIYGNGTATDANNRYIRLGGIVSGSGVLNVSQFGAVRLSAAHTYTGQTQIDNGELWIESGGSIASGSGIFVGNGGQLGNVAKLWLSNASGGTTFSNSLTINDGNLTTREIGGLNTSGTHTFSGAITNNSTTGGLRLTALNAGGSVTFSGALGGAGSYIAPGAGIVTLSNTGNNYTGTTTVSGGTLRLGAAGVIPNSSNMVLSGGTLSTGATTGFSEAMGTLQLTANSTISLGTGFHNLEFANSSAAGWTAGANLIVTGWAGTYGGGTAGTAGRFLVGFPNAGGLTPSQLARIYFFNGTNYFTATQLSNGEVVPNAGIAMFWGSTAATAWTATTGTRWDLNPTGTTFGTTWVSARSAVFNVASSTIGGLGANTNVGSITANESASFSSTSNNLNFGPSGGAVIPIFVAGGKTFNLSTQTITAAAGGGYIKNGPGALQLSGNTFAGGVTLNEGMIAAGGVNAMGATSFLFINGGTIAGTANRTFTGKFPSGIFIRGDFTLGSTTAPAIPGATLLFDNATDLDIFTTRTITLGGTGLITWNGVISGVGPPTITPNLVFASSVGGTISLGAANTYSGNTTLNGATLRCGIASALPATTGVTLSNNSGSVLNLNGLNQSIAFLSGGGATGGNVTLGAATLTLDQGTNTSYDGTISGTGGLTKSGAGTLTLSGANTYTGLTSINGGTLQLGAADRIANTSNMVLNGGIFNTGGFSETVGTLTLNQSSVIQLGGTGTLTFANSSAITWANSSVATLIINGWTGTAGSAGSAGRIFFSSTSDLTPTQLAQISFTGYAPGATILPVTFELVPAIPVTPGPPSITSFTPSSGQVGTLVTITGTNLGNPTAFSIGGIAAISVSNNGTTLVGMVMPGATTGLVTVTTAQGTISGGGNFTVTATPFPTTQQGSKLVGTLPTGAARQGQSVAISANGNTAIVGGGSDNSSAGAVWIYTRSGSTWTQQGTKLVGTGGIVAGQGSAVALSADGNTAVVGGNQDDGNKGAVWVFVRSGSTWFQQGSKLVGTGAVGTALQGSAVAISADGNTILSGGYFDNSQVGAVWVFTRTSGFWSQQGSKLVGTGAAGASYQGISVALSADGNTAMVGGSQDNSGAGAAWVFTRSAGVWSQQGGKLLPTGATGNAERGGSVSLSADGNTALIGGPADNSSRGAFWAFTRSGSTWTQQGSKLVGTGFTGGSSQGASTALSADGNSAVIGGWFDNSQAGAIWVFTRSGTTWTQQGSKLVGTGAVGSAQQGLRVALSSDGFTAMAGGPNDNTSAGAAWVYVLAPPTITTTVAASSITNTTASSGGQTITGSVLTAKGVVYSLGSVTTTPTLANSVLTDANIPVTSADFTSSISGLTPQSQYYVRSYVTNAAGTAYGTAINFRTLSNPPSSQAGGLTATPTAAGQLTVTWTAATWPGFNANNAGYALIYSTGTPTLSSANGTAPAAGVGTLVNLGSILPTEPALTSVITGLTAGTTYNFLLVPFTWDGTNAATYHYLTAGAPTASAIAVNNPAVTATTAISSITNNTASGGGTGITAGGGNISAKGLVWNIAPSPTTANSSTSDGTGTADFTSSLLSLSPQTLYYVRAYATNEVSTAYGPTQTFRTLSNPPAAHGGSLGAIPTGASQLTASWTPATWPASGATRAGYALIYSAGTPTLASANGSAPAAGPGGTLVNLGAVLPTEPSTSVVIGVLTAGTTYNFLLVPYTWDGTNATTYHYLTSGAPTASAVAMNAPGIATTAAITSITESSASGGGSGILTGGGNITAKGVVWNTAAGPTTANSLTSDGSGAADFSSSLTGLSPQTLYYVRTYVTNALTTAYGPQVTFRTLSNEPTADAGSFSATVAGPAQINLGWSAASFPVTGASAGGYIILRRSDGNDPTTANVTDGLSPGLLSLPSGTTLVTTITSGATLSFNNTGLSAATQYNYLIIPFSWDGVNTVTYNYLTASAPSANATTLAAVPTAQPTGLVFSDVTASTITASWNPASGSPAGYLVLRSTGSAPDTDPVPGTTYSEGDILGNATVVYAGSGTSTGPQSGLLTATTYYYEVFSYNGSGTIVNYRTAFPLGGNRSTWLCLASPALLTWYLDADGDGWYTATQSACTSPGTGWTSTLPSGGSSDCDDNDPAKSQTFSFYADNDGDGFGAGSLIPGICAVNSTTAPAGYSTNNTDCAPTDPAINARFSFYADTDGDGFGAGGLVGGICALNSSSPPAGYSTNNTDCAPSDPAINARFSFYADTDGDGFGAGTLIGGICALNSSSPPAGYSTNNTDCAPSDNSKWQQASFFIDQDNDGYDGGSANVCYGATIPAPYISSTLGADCNDNNNLINTSIPAPSTTAVSRCGSGPVNLLASTGAGETIDWYADASGGSPLLSGNTSYNIPFISDTTIFYAEARNPVSGCVSSSRTALTVTVIPRPTASINANDFVCEGQTAPIDIEFTGSSPWSLQYRINSVIQPTVNSAAPVFSTSYSGATVNREYAIASLTDATGCAANVLDTLLIEVPIPCYITWNGSVNNDWNNPANWTPSNSPPSTKTSVFIGSATNQPQISTAIPAAVCANAIFQTGSAPLISSGFSLTVRGDLSGGAGNSFAGDGKLVLNGTGTQNILGNLRLGNVEFANTGGGVLVSAGNRLEIAPGATATFLPGSKLTNSGDFVLASNATGTAKIGAIPATASITGPVTIERWLPHGSSAGSWYFVGTPFSGQNFTELSDDFRVCGPVTGFGSQGASIIPSTEPERYTVFEYDETLNNTQVDVAQKDGWKAPGNQAMEAGKGYRVFVNYNSNWQHKFDTRGSLVRNDFTFPALTRSVYSSCSPATYTCNLNRNGWNLLSNPYPCPVDWSFATGWNKPANMNDAFYVWNSVAGGYRAYNGTLAVDLGVTLNGGALPNIIPSSQAFFVKLMSGPTGTLSVKESAKVTNTSGTFLRTATDDSFIRLRLKKTGQSGYHFDAMVRFEEGSTQAFDMHRDMDLLPGSTFEFSFPSAENNLLLNSQEALGQEIRIVPISINTGGYPGQFSFEIPSQNLPEGSAVFIRDHLLGEITEMIPGGIFQFEVTSADAAVTDRFELLISPDVVTGRNIRSESETLVLAPNPADPGKETWISLKGFSGNEARIQVADMTGRVIFSRNVHMQNGTLVYPLDCAGIPAGIYSVQVSAGQKKLTLKLIQK